MGMGLAVLGPLAVTVDDREVVVAGYRRRALLARLALAGGQPVAADRLAEDLWEDDPARRSIPTLRTYVAKLRTLLPGGASLLTSGPAGYALAIGPDDVDAGRFERLVASVGDDPADAEPVLTAALASWRGGAYEEFAHLDWARPEAVRLDELRLVAHERLFDARLALGRAAEIVPALVAMTAANPLREHLYAQLVVALYRAGRQADALDAQRRAVAFLRDELGLEPGPELAGLERRILQHDPTLAPAPTGSAATTPRPATATLPPGLRPRRADPAFVGRAAELARIEAAFDAAEANGARLVLLRGEPGIGKTRLAARAAAAALRRGATLLYGRCDDRLAVPYQPYAEALRELAARRPRDMLVPDLGDDPGALAALVPELAPVLPAPAGAERGAEELRLFAAVASWLSSTAASGPVLLVLDDLHWASPSTLHLTRHVVRTLDDRPLVVLATARSTAPDAAPGVVDLAADLRRDRAVDVVDVEGLDAVAASELLAGELGAGQAEVAPYVSATAGNPFLLTELARAGTGVDGGAAPPSVADVVLARVARLPAPAADALRVAAVAGVEFGLDVVAAVLACDDDEALQALDDAAAAGLVAELDGAAGRYCFVHGIVQRAVADAHRPTRRARLHAAVARALAAGNRPASEVAFHWRSAGPAHAATAAEWSAVAGRQAMRQHAHAEAVRHLDDALALADAAEPTWRAAVLLDRAEARARLGDATTARADLLEAAVIARTAGDPVLLARAALASSVGGRGVSAWAADPTRVGLLAESAAALPDAERVLRIRVTGELALARHRPEERAVRHQLGREAVALAEGDGSPEALVAGLAASRVAFWHPADTERRLAYARSVLAAVGGDGDPWVASDAIDWIAADCCELGDRAGFDDAVARCRTLAADVGGSAIPWRATVWAAAVATLEARFDDGHAHAAAALACWGEQPATDAVQTFGFQEAALLLLEGRAAEAVPLGDQAVALFPGNGGIVAARAMVLAHAGRLEEAAADVERLAADDLALLPRDSQWLVALGCLAEAAAATGARAAAEAIAAELAPFADRFAVLAGPGIVWGPVAHHLAALSRALGRDADAAAYAARAVDVCRAFGAPAWQARAEAQLADRAS